MKQLLEKNPTRVVIWALLLVLGGVSVERSVRGSSDFRGFHKIWSDNAVAATQPIRGVGTDPDPYPPSSYAIFAPLGYLPILPAAIVWYLLNVAASWGAWRGLEELSEEKLTGTETGWLLFASIAPFWVGNLVSGQNGTILICLVVWGYLFAWRYLYKLAGVVLAVPVLIKAIPVLFLMPFVVSKKFLERDWRIVVAACCAIGIWIGGVCSLYFGVETNALFQKRWVGMVVRGPNGVPADPFRPKSMHSGPRYGNQSSEAVLARLMLDIPVDGKESGVRVNLWSLESATWRRVRTGFAVLVLLAGMVVLWRSGDRLSGLSQVSLMSLVMLLISPIVWTHYYLWMAFPCLDVLRMRKVSKGAWILMGCWWVGEAGLGSAWLRAVGLHFWLVLLFFLTYAVGGFLAGEAGRIEQAT
ncbi:MAG: DUF2029 domain-containing protein [Planctomycetaceae bacterium]|nr:DUF2029 domain-containing protein [Planctomycetaceae bacterium]